MKKVLFVFFSLILVIMSACSEETTNKSETKSLPQSDEFDGIVSSGDDYYLVLKVKDDQDYIGVVDENAKWIQPLTDAHIFINGTQVYRMQNTVPAEGTATLKMRIDDLKAGITYAGEGVFVCVSFRGGGGNTDYVMYNAKDNLSFEVGQFEWPSKVDVTQKVIGGGYAGTRAQFSEGYLVGRVEDRGSTPIKIISTKGEVKTLSLTPENGDIFDLSQFSGGSFSYGGTKYDADGNIK